MVRGAGPAEDRRALSSKGQATETTSSQVFRLRYLLDTNVCIALINGKPAAVRDQFNQEIAKGSIAHISSISVFELWYGIAKSSRLEENSQLLGGYLSGPVAILPFEGEDARRSGEIRAEMESIGKPIGAYDLLIAGQALRHEMTLVTANTREFGRVKKLVWEDWTKG
jgi:tRNA(fMet)-specific endonuclease VapC